MLLGFAFFACSSGLAPGPDSGGEEPDVLLRVCGDGAADFATLPGAVAAAPDGAVLHLCAGAWPGSLFFRRVLTLVGEGADVTTLVATDVPAIEAHGSTLRIEGIGFADAGASRVLVLAEHSTITLRDVAVTGCADAQVFSLDHSPIDIREIDFSANTGCHLLETVGNSAGPVTLSHGRFRGNTLPWDWARFPDGSTVRNSLFVDNLFDSSINDEMVILLGEAELPVTMENNTFVGNRLTTEAEAEGQVGAILYGPVAGTFRDNIVADNALGVYSDLVTAGTRAFNDLWANADAPATGELAADPRFIDAAAGDYRLGADSPCIDAGDPAAPPDADGSANDLGVTGGPDPLEWPW